MPPLQKNLTSLRQQLEPIRQQYNLKLILLHGSQVTGQTHDQSDIDIAVLKQQRQQRLQLLNLYQDFKQIFKSDQVDVAVLNGINPVALKAMTDQAVVLAGDKQDFHQLQLKALHLYNDYLPILRQERQFLLKQFRQYQQPAQPQQRQPDSEERPDNAGSVGSKAAECGEWGSREQISKDKAGEIIGAHRFE